MLIVNILIAFGYMVILTLCMTLAYRGNSAISSDQALYHRIIFICIPLILIFMITTRLLDLNDFLTREGRMLAKYDGWYDGRRTLQILFVSGVIIAAILSFILLESKLDTIWQCYYKAFLGTIFLISFLVINMVSYHPIDQLLGKNIGGISVSRIIELLNITWIVIALLFSYRHASNTPKKIHLAPGSKFI